MTTVADESVAELRAERDALLAQIAGDPSLSLGFYQRKVTRQRRALDAMNRKLVSQRFVLRTLAGLGRVLSAEEYKLARDAEPEQLRDRIEAPDAK